MLNSLHIKNLALIDEQEITFENGLNVLTGETGAGKSIVIGSINLALGEQARGSLIREGAEYALITLTFTDLAKETLDAIRAMELPVEADGTLVLERRILPARSVAKVCGETVSLKQLRDLAALIIQIHGQNDHQSLLQKTEQGRLLDLYAGEDIRGALAETESAFTAYEESVRRLKACEIDEGTRKREEDLAAYELKEITDAALKAGEDEALEETFRRMANAEKIMEALQAANLLTQGTPDAASVLDLVGRALKELHGVQAFDKEVAAIASALEDCDAILQDVGRAVSDAMDHNAFDASLHEEVSERLNKINRLKDKYGGSIEAVLNYAAQKEEELQRLKDLDAERDRARAALEETKGALLRACEALSEKRKQHALKLTKQMQTLLADLNFLDNGFLAEVQSDPANASASGFDEVTFLISLNPGEPLKPLHEIASGGELSRIMLALKTALADAGGMETMIFDEIDAGISGQTAWKVAERLAALSEGRQVILITHLAQIAAMEDVHFLIDKQVRNEAEGVRTLTFIRRLAGEESLAELARLLGGTLDAQGETDAAALENARRLKQEAEHIRTKR